MKKFTKLMALVLSVAMLATCFVACGGNENKNEAPTTTPATTPATTAPAGTGEKTVLKMGTNAYFPPYEYYDGQTIVGIDAEIAKAIADKLGMELEIVDMSFDSIISAVNSGTVDFGMAGMTVKPDRLKEVDFSNSYAKGVQSVIVVEGSEITDVDKLLSGNYKVGVQTGTTGDIYMSSSPEDGGVGEDRIERFAKGNDAVIALQSGKIDAVVIDNEPAKAFVAAANK